MHEFPSHTKIYVGEYLVMISPAHLAALTETLQLQHYHYHYHLLLPGIYFLTILSIALRVAGVRRYDSNTFVLAP